jgi:hypothetical protein
VSRFRTEIARASVVVFAVLALQTTSQAQVNRYGATPQHSASPYQSRLSPYLNLLRTDNSVLTPYHSFVQPRIQFQRNLNRQAHQIGQLERASVGSGSSSQTESTTRRQTGRGGSFNNYLHFYRFNSPLQSR